MPDIENNTILYSPTITGGTIDSTSITSTTVSASYINNCHANTLTIGGTSITEGKIILSNREINLNNVLTADDLEDTEGFEVVYKVLFMKLCKLYKEEADKFNALLKIYSYNYRNTVLAIETKRLKDELHTQIKDLG